MRDIIFRGKRKDTGALIISDSILRYDSVIRLWDTKDGYVEIAPDTLGEYTGLTDKNGVKIFEGDIVETQPFSDRPYSKRAKYKRHIGVVEQRVAHFKNSQYEQDYKCEWWVNIKDCGEFVHYDWSRFFKCEIIGNIYDTPELVVESKHKDEMY